MGGRPCSSKNSPRQEAKSSTKNLKRQTASPCRTQNTSPGFHPSPPRLTCNRPAGALGRDSVRHASTPGTSGNDSTWCVHRKQAGLHTVNAGNLATLHVQHGISISLIPACILQDLALQCEIREKKERSAGQKRQWDERSEACVSKGSSQEGLGLAGGHGAGQDSPGQDSPDEDMRAQGTHRPSPQPSLPPAAAPPPPTLLSGAQYPDPTRVCTCKCAKRLPGEMALDLVPRHGLLRAGAAPSAEGAAGQGSQESPSCRFTKQQPDASSSTPAEIASGLHRSFQRTERCWKPQTP